MAKTQAEVIRQLEITVATLEQRLAYLERAEAANVVLRQENAVLKSRLDDHIKRLDTWATRAWGLVPVLVGAVLSLAAGLIATLARR